jgi:VCBS repeat-containing protein
VFTVSVDGDGKVTLTQLQQVDHSQSDDAAPYDGDQVTLADGKIELTATATIEDADGDTATDSETIDLGGNLVFDDDGPDAEDDVDSVKEDTGDFATGNVIVPGDGGLGETDDNTDDGVADAAGADGLDSIAWTDVVDDKDGDYVLGTYGKLYVDADGNYKYDLDDTNADLATLDDGETATDTFTYTITDGDGDTSTATLTITIDGSTDDKAKGTLDVTSCVFEDLQPLQFKGDATQQFEKLEITFTPDDNEEATAARITIPTGWQVQVWDTTGGGSEVAVLTAGTDVDIGTYIASVLDGTYELRPIPPENSDVDADFGLEIDIKDPDSGLTNTLSKDFTVLVDAVADLPTNVTITTIDSGKTSAGKDADTADNFSFGKDETGSVTVSANFSDLDGSEVHTIKIDLSDGDFQFDNPGTAGIDYADSGSGSFKYNYKGTDYQIDFSFTTDGEMELTIPTEIGEFSKTFNIRNTGKDSVAVENFVSTVSVVEEPEDGGCADDGSDLNVEGQAGDNTAEVSVSPQRPNILNGTFITNTNVQKQLALLTFVDSVDPLRAFAQILVRGSQGQQGAILSDAGFLIDAVHEHLVSVEATAGTKVIITDFDLEGVVIVDPGNAQLEVNDVPGGPDSTGLVQLITPSTEAGTLQAFESSKDDATATASNLADANAGNAGNADYVFGGTQNDAIAATAGPNVLNGGNILDPVTADKDTITGGSGTDVLVFDGGDSLNGGAGFDILRIDEGAIFNTMTKEGLSTAGLGIDATVNLTNQNISNIESILITEEGTVDDKAGTKLILEAQDVLDFTDNSKEGDGVNGDTLYIIGSKGDSVELDLGSVTFTTQAVNDTARGMTFTQYNLSNGGTLIVDTDVTVNTIP